MAATKKKRTGRKARAKKAEPFGYGELDGWPRGAYGAGAPMTKRVNLVTSYVCAETVHPGSDPLRGPRLVLEEEADQKRNGTGALFALRFTRYISSPDEPCEEVFSALDLAELVALATMFPALIERAVEEGVLPKNFPMRGWRMPVAIAEEQRT